METQKLTTIKYNKIENLIPAHVQQIRKTLEDKYGLKVPTQCDEFVARCLRLKDGNVEKAIKLVQTYYVATEDFKDWNAILLPSLHSNFYKTGMVTQLLNRDTEGRRIVVVRTELWNPKETNFDEMIACIWMMAQIVVANNVDAQRDGYVTIWDFSNFTLQQALAVNHWKLLSLSKWAENGAVGRMKALHSINHPRVVNLIYAAINPFLKKKLQKRIHFNENKASLLKHVPANALPIYLGGTENPDLCVDRALINALVRQDKYFQDMMNHRLPTK